MLEFILSYYFLIFWGLSLSVLILLAITIIYKKEFSDKIIALYNKFIKDPDPHIPKFEMIIDQNICILKNLEIIKTDQEKIYEKLEQHDRKLETASSPPMIFDVDELSQDIAETLSAKLKVKKVDKLSKGS